MNRPFIFYHRKVVIQALAICCLAPEVTSQTTTADRQTQHLFPEIADCTVRMKTGSLQSLLTNYNTLTESLVFIKDSVRNDMTKIMFIYTVTISDRKFVPVNGIFYEVPINAPVKYIKVLQYVLQSSALHWSG